MIAGEQRGSSVRGATELYEETFRATQAKDDETVIFSWIEYPDKATRDDANEKMSNDPEAMGMEMPFDGSRMFWGGFELVLDE